MISKKQALDYHSVGRKGKIEVTSTKPCITQVDLSLAYTPGVAEPCREIHKNPEDIAGGVIVFRSDLRVFYDNCLEAIFERKRAQLRCMAAECIFCQNY